MFGKRILGSAYLFDGSSKRARHRQLDEGAAQRIRVEDAQQWPGMQDVIQYLGNLHLGILTILCIVIEGCSWLRTCRASQDRSSLHMPARVRTQVPTQRHHVPPRR